MVPGERHRLRFTLMTRTHIHLPDDLRAALAAEAVRRRKQTGERISESQIVREALVMLLSPVQAVAPDVSP